MMKQSFNYGIENLNRILEKEQIKKAFIVCDSSFGFLNIKEDILNIKIPYIVFDSFSSNPLHDDADKGRELFIRNNCDVIIAVGGGSSIDVAKCIKLDSNSEVPIIAIPTTAGTGSESTRHIVVYRNNKKESLGEERIIPNYVIFEPKVLKSLPLYQKKCTMMDALCQGIESYWSIKANKETREYSKNAIQLIIRNMNKYINENDDEAAKNIMLGANYSGRAIDLTQTTAPHAMSYKMSSLYNLPHGHAVALCLPKVWKSMMSNNPNLQLLNTFNDISSLLGYKTIEKAIEGFEMMICSLDLKGPHSLNERKEEIEILSNSVNLVRLQNNPIQFTKEEIKDMYEKIIL